MLKKRNKNSLNLTLIKVKKRRKGALELSVGTIVVIVLAMSMLILGLVLVKSIFGGAKYNIDQMSEKVRGEINKMFVEDKKTVVYLPNQIAKIKQGTDWGIAFAFKNLVKGSVEGNIFSYEVIVSDPDIKEKCGITEKDVKSWMITGRSDTQINLGPGDTYAGRVRFAIPEGAPLCTMRFHLDVKMGDKHYATDFFDVEVAAK